MNKCEFCNYSMPKDGSFVCTLSIHEAFSRQFNCNQAVDKMLKAIKYQSNARNTKTYNINKRTEDKNK